MGPIAQAETVEQGPKRRLGVLGREQVERAQLAPSGHPARREIEQPLLEPAGEELVADAVPSQVTPPGPAASRT